MLRKMWDSDGTMIIVYALVAMMHLAWSAKLGGEGKPFDASMIAWAGMLWAGCAGMRLGTSKP